MKVATVRAILALMTVGVFMGITAFMALYPLLSDTNVALTEYSDFFSKTSSVYTGIVGVVIGYYFGRAVESGPTKPPVQNTATADAASQQP